MVIVLLCFCKIIFFFWSILFWNCFCLLSLLRIICKVNIGWVLGYFVRGVLLFIKDFNFFFADIVLGKVFNNFWFVVDFLIVNNKVLVLICLILWLDCVSLNFW